MIDHEILKSISTTNGFWHIGLSCNENKLNHYIIKNETQNVILSHRPKSQALMESQILPLRTGL